MNKICTSIWKTSTRATGIAYARVFLGDSILLKMLVIPRRVISCPSHWVRCWLSSEMKEFKKKKAAKMKEK